MDDHFTGFPPFNSLPFEKHLQNNYLSTPIELAQLQELFQTATAEDARLDELFEALQARRAALRSYTDKLAIALAPSRKIPSDVLGVIFGFIEEDYLQLSRVCRRWRDVALSMPSLWTTLPDIGIPVKSATGFLRCIEAHRSRAGSRPLDVRRLSLPLKFGFTHRKFKKFLSLFQNFIPRIRVLNVDVGENWTPVDLSLLAMFPQTSFDRLDALHLNFQNPEDGPPPDEQIAIVKNGPNLSRMTFAFPMLHNLPPLFEWLDLPWANFSSLKLGWITWGDVYAILDHSPRLEKLAVVVDAVYARTPFPTTKISHPKLRVFHATSNDLNGPALPYLDLPRATSIYLNVDDRAPRSDDIFEELHIQAIQNVLPSFTFKYLTRLFLGSQARYDSSGYELASILQFTPSVVELWAAWVKDMWVFFAALCKHALDGGHLLLPSLASLRICKFPGYFLREKKHRIWHTTINQLASQRGNEGLGDAPLSITLAFSTFMLDSRCPRKKRHRAVKLLNQAIVLKDMLGPAPGNHTYDLENWEVDRKGAIRELSGPADQILKLANEYKPPSSESNGVAYDTWKLDWKARMYSAIADTIRSGTLKDSVLFRTATLKNKNELRDELLQLSEVFPDDGSRMGALVNSLLIQWRGYQEEYLSSPGWVSIEEIHYDQDQDQDKLKAAGIVYVPSKNSAPSATKIPELLSPCQWGLGEYSGCLRDICDRLEFGTCHPVAT